MANNNKQCPNCKDIYTVQAKNSIHCLDCGYPNHTISKLKDIEPGILNDHNILVHQMIEYEN